MPHANHVAPAFAPALTEMMMPMRIATACQPSMSLIGVDGFFQFIECAPLSIQAARRISPRWMALR